MRIDTFPTNKIQNLEYRIGRVFPFGATVTEGAVNFSVFSKEATGCTLVLYHQGEKDPFVEIPFPESFRIGNVYTMMVFGINIETTEYGYRFEGPYRPEEGLLFDSSRVMLDPYARSVSGRLVWGEVPKDGVLPPHRGQIIREDYDWEGDKPLEIKPEDHQKYGTEKDFFLYVAINAWWEDWGFTLPELPEGFSWKLAGRSDGPFAAPGSEQSMQDRHTTLGPRTTAVFIGN